MTAPGSVLPGVDQPAAGAGNPVWQGEDQKLAYDQAGDQAADDIVERYLEDRGHSGSLFQATLHRCQRIGAAI